MIGNSLKNKCKIFDVIKTVEISKGLLEPICNLERTNGKCAGVGFALKNVYHVETTDEINKDLNKNLKEKVMIAAREMQEILDIDDKFFICDVSKNIINIFDISYDEFLDKRGFVSEDFTKAIIPI